MSSIKELDLARLRTAYDLHNFIETGCYQGDGIAAAVEAGFENIYSCDIDPQSVDHCRRRFAGFENIHLIASDSLSALTEFCRTVNEPALFWLDAHFPSYYGNEPADSDQVRFPLASELEIIAGRSNMDRDVIAFDDLRVICSEDNTRWREGELPEYFVVRGLSLRALTKPFNATHRFTVVNVAEGIGLLSHVRSEDGTRPYAR